MRSFVMLFDANEGEFVKEAVYNLPPKQALINAVMQYRGDYNTENYPKEIDGIYKSKMVKDRLLFDLSENLTLYSQEA